MRGGSHRGKIESLMAFELDGRNYFKEKELRISPPIVGELVNQFNFDPIQKWLQPLLEVVRVGVWNYAPTFG